MTTEPVSYAFPSGHDGHPSCANMPHGLTKRELFAAMALQGLLTNPDTDMDPAGLANDAVLYANALLTALDVSKETT